MLNSASLQKYKVRKCYLAAKFTDKQYITTSQSTAGHFDPTVFVNCLQVEKSCETRLFIWLQNGDITNECVNIGNTRIGADT